MSTSFKHNELTTSPALGGQYDCFNAPQGFAIYSVDPNDKKNYLKRTEAQATFQFRGYMVSISTAGLNHGACLSEVLVRDSDCEIVHTCHSVEEAIDWILDN